MTCGCCIRMWNVTDISATPIDWAMNTFLVFQPLQQHIVTIPTVCRLLEKLSMVGKDVNSGYKLCLVRMVDWELASQHGFTFSDEAKDTLFNISDVFKLHILKDENSELFSDRLDRLVFLVNPPQHY